MVLPVSGAITKKKKYTIVYPNVPSALRPVPRGEGISVPEPPKEFTIDSDDEDEGESTSSCPRAKQSYWDQDLKTMESSREKCPKFFFSQSYSAVGAFLQKGR